MTENEITLGSLFDGIGGFPFCAQIMGARPVWAAEINPFCAAVTHHHFPDMLNLGDVSKINGAGIPPVDIITFGSPCQDLSVAGKRAGLDGERSGLFRDAVRIIYERGKRQMEGIQLTLFGRTSQERSLHIMGETFKRCSGKSQRPIFQCLNLDDGQTPEWFEVARCAPRGGCSMLNFGECPSEESASILLEVWKGEGEK